MTTLQPSPRKLTRHWNGELGIWQYPPESIFEWVRRSINFVRATHSSPPEDLELVVSYDSYRELLQELPMGYVGLEDPHLFSAKLTLRYDLPVPFEVRWRSQEEQALQAMLDRL